MNEVNCEKCGREIPTEAFDGRCPYCLLLEATGFEESGEEMSSSRDSNILFALLAHLLSFISAPQLVSALSYWAANPGIRMSALLVERELVSSSNRDYVEGLMEQTLEFHDGNAGAAINALGGFERLEGILRQGADSTQRTLLTTKLGLKGTDVADDDDVPVFEAVDEKLGRYTRTREFSRGGMGRILLVHDELLLRDIALKELLPKSDDDASTPEADTPMRQSGAMVARFLREARITGSLEHPTIVPVYELGRRENGSLYYTMKLVRGKTLRMALDECRTLSDRLRLLPNFLDLCLGVGYAHSKGIVHRDLKPSNVMVGEFGETVIIDWGLAKIVGVKDDDSFNTLKQYHGPEAINPDKTIEGEKMGSPNYMSPEQAAGKVERIDTRSDVFSLGTMLYELLTGCVPFMGASIEEIMQEVEECVFDLPNSLERHAPVELSSVCLRALSKEPAKRYASAKDMGEDIRNFQTGSLVSVYQYSLRERVARYYRSNSTLVNVSLASAILIVVIAVSAFISVTNSRDRAIVARNEATVANENAEYTRHVAQIKLASTYVEQNNLANAANTLWEINPEYRSWDWEFLLEKTNPEIFRLDGYADVALSPREDFFVAAAHNYPVGIFDFTTGRKVAELDTRPSSTLAMEYSPEGDRLLTASRENKVQLWDMRANALIREFSTGSRNPNYAHFIADGQRILSAASNGDVRIWNATTGERVETLRCGPGLTDVHEVPGGNSLIAYRGDQGETEIQAWSTADFVQQWTAEGRRPAIVSDEELLCIRGNDIVSLSIQDGTEQYQLSRHRAEVTRIAVDPERRRAVTGDIAGRVIVWDLDTQTPLGGNAFLSNEIVRISIVPSGSHALVGAREGDIALMTMPDGRVQRHLAGHKQFLHNLLVGSQSQVVFSSSRDRTVRKWPLHREPGAQTLFASDSRSTALQALENGLVTVSQLANSALVVDMENKTIPEMLAGRQTASVGTTHFTRDGRHGLLNLDGMSLIIYDRSSRRVVRVLSDHTGSLTAADAANDLERIVTGGWDGNVIVYGADGVPLRIYAGDSPVSTLAVARDDANVIIGFESGTVFKIDLNELDDPGVFAAHNDKITDMDFSLDGTRLVITSMDKTATIWDCATYQIISRLGPANHPIMNGSFDDGAQRVATITDINAVAGREVRIWDLRTRAELMTIQSNRENVIGIEFLHGWPLELNIGGKLRWHLSKVIEPERRNTINREEYKQLRDAALNERDYEGIDSAEVERITLFMSKTAASEVLRRIVAEGLETRIDDTLPGVPVVQSDLLAIGLALGNIDAVVRIDGAVMNSVTQVVSEFESVAADIESDARESFRIEFLRGSEYIRQEFLLGESKQDTESIALPREELVEQLTRIADAIDDFSEQLDDIQQFKNEGSAVVVDRNGSAGFLVAWSSMHFTYDDYLRIGIGGRDRILEIDGRPINGADSMAEEMRQSIQAIEQDETDEIQFRIQRGEFRESIITISAN